MGDLFVLEGHTPIPVTETDTPRWARMIEDSESRRVAKTTVGDADVSTVFLGIDYNWTGKGPPLVFETMIFGGNYDQETWRWSTWNEAEAGHTRIVAALTEGRNPE